MSIKETIFLDGQREWGGGGGGENIKDQLYGRKDRKYMWTVYITTFWLIQEALPKILRYKEFFQQS